MHIKFNKVDYLKLWLVRSFFGTFGLCWDRLHLKKAKNNFNLKFYVFNRRSIGTPRKAMKHKIKN